MQLADEPLGGCDLVRGTFEGHLIAAHHDGDRGELMLDRGEQAILRAEKPDHGHAIHLEFGAGSATCTDARR